jgi:hypothetical protein
LASLLSFFIMLALKRGAVMTSLEKRIERLAGRASRDAWLYLQDLRHHPEFPELLAHLEQIEGTLLQTHIEQALRRFPIPHPKKN